MKHILTCFVFLILGIQSIGQHRSISAQVVDTKKKEGLAFVNIYVGDGELGAVSDVDGYFKINVPLTVDSITFSLIGYEKKSVAVNDDLKQVKLSAIHYEFDEVVILPGINPAEELMKKVIRNKVKNDPENIPSYTCDYYDKVVYTYSMDSASISSKKYESPNWYKFIEKHHLFLIESVVERSYKAKDQIHDVVKGNRVSGLKQPNFSITSMSLQPLSSYTSYLNIADKSYVGPLFPRSWNKYLFIMEDTLYNGMDTTFVLSFRPKKGTNFEGLEGFLHIDRNTHAVERLTAENAEKSLYDFTIKQKYKKVNNSVWFPDQLTARILWRKESILFLGETYFKEPNLSPGLDSKSFGHMELEIDDEANKRDSLFWSQYRNRALDKKEKNTYQYIDSIGEVINLDKRMKVMDALVDGKLGLGPVGLVMNRIAGYNEFEGFRLGVGLETNDKVYKWASVGGYYAYGFNDTRNKFGGYLDIHPFRNKENKFLVSYSQDVETPGRLRFIKNKLPAVTNQYLNLLTDWKNEVERLEVAYHGRILDYGNIELFGAQEVKNITNDYRFGREGFNDGDVAFDNQYTFSKAGLRFRYAHGEKFVESFGSKLSLGTTAPIFWLNYTHAFDGVGEGEFSYNKVEGKVYKAFKTPVLGQFTLSLSGGYIDKNVPLTEMFIPNASYDEELLVHTDLSFQTMGYFEFSAQYFGQLFYTHKLWRWYSPYEFVRPEFVMSHAVAWGGMDDNKIEQHFNFPVQSLEKGYFESGLLVNHLFRMSSDMYYFSFGGGLFYRYGEYAHDDAKDNLIPKVSFLIEL